MKKGSLKEQGFEDNGQWRIPEENFITMKVQDEAAENILRQIDKKNEKAE